MPCGCSSSSGSSDEQIRRRYLSQNHVLNDIRSDVYVSGTYVRDYLLEPDPQRAEVYRTSLEDVRKHMESALDVYGRQAAPAEVQHYCPSGRAYGLLGNPGSDLSMGSRRRGAVRDTPFCGMRCSRAGRTCWRSPTGLPHQRTAVDGRERSSGFSVAPASKRGCW